MGSRNGAIDRATRRIQRIRRLVDGLPQRELAWSRLPPHPNGMSDDDYANLAIEDRSAFPLEWSGVSLPQLEELAALAAAGEMTAAQFQEFCALAGAIETMLPVLGRLHLDLPADAFFATAHALVDATAGSKVVAHAPGHHLAKPARVSA